MTSRIINPEHVHPYELARVLAAILNRLEWHLIVTRDDNNTTYSIQTWQERDHQKHHPENSDDL